MPHLSVACCLPAARRAPHTVCSPTVATFQCCSCAVRDLPALADRWKGGLSAACRECLAQSGYAGADLGGVGPSPGADVAAVSRVLAQIWARRNMSHVHTPVVRAGAPSRSARLLLTSSAACLHSRSHPNAKAARPAAHASARTPSSWTSVWMWRTSWRYARVRMRTPGDPTRHGPPQVEAILLTYDQTQNFTGHLEAYKVVGPPLAQSRCRCGPGEPTGEPT